MEDVLAQTDREWIDEHPFGPSPEAHLFAGVILVDAAPADLYDAAPDDVATDAADALLATASPTNQGGEGDKI